MENKLPIYEITIDNLENEEELGLQCVSLVDFPAIERNFEYFSDKKMFYFDSDRHIVTGVALIPDMKIYRFNKELGEYYVFFSKETIEKLVEKYSREGKLNLIDVMHDGNITEDKATLLESFLVSEEHKYKDFPVGSWIVSYKIHDEELWNEIKKKELRGFSVEVIADCVRKFAKKEETFDEWLNSFFFSVPMSDVIDAVVNHYICMISSYDDEKPAPALGRRQVILVACGLSKAGNPVARAYQYYGDHRDFDHDWELLRLDRISSFRVMKEMNPWDIDDLFSEPDGALLNPFFDKSMSTVFATAF